jgi:hypothetical protein
VSICVHLWLSCPQFLLSLAREILPLFHRAAFDFVLLPLPLTMGWKRGILGHEPFIDRRDN